MKNETVQLVQNWFNGLNQSDIHSLLKLFAPSTKIRNAANSLMEGENAARQLLEIFFQRTESRFLFPMEITQQGNEVFAHWKGYLTFAAGIQIADTVLDKPVTVPFRGVERFILDDNGKIVECDIVHETTSPVLYARASKSQPNFVTADKAADVVKKYFELEEIGDVEGVVELCHPNVVVVNAANPTQFGKKGVRQYVQTFKDRTAQRKFIVGTISIHNDNVMVWWDAKITFKAGITFGLVTSKAEFDADIKGVCRFKFTADGQIIELDVFHETTTALLLAQKTNL
jgi:ketosteroid isomerase-like protein